MDILVNNAGIVTGKKFLSCPDNMIQKTMEVNAIAHFWVKTIFDDHMLIYFNQVKQANNFKIWQ